MGVVVVGVVVGAGLIMPGVESAGVLETRGVAADAAVRGGMVARGEGWMTIAVGGGGVAGLPIGDATDCGGRDEMTAEGVDNMRGEETGVVLADRGIAMIGDGFGGDEPLKGCDELLLGCPKLGKEPVFCNTGTFLGTEDNTPPLNDICGLCPNGVV